MARVEESARGHGEGLVGGRALDPPGARGPAECYQPP